ncbi:Vacuolar ATPase assembly integral membrane protein VMA21 [Hordeum vulgare]|nr:Vacuolar ATPase assembly integral membrane protein VMA21 [Hordeum vulgare]
MLRTITATDRELGMQAAFLSCGRIPLEEAMSGVIIKFTVTSMFMWMAPVAIIYGFYHQIFPGISELSSSARTLASGFLAVISVNIVIGFYIYSAMMETPCQEPQPDATFLENAKASINHPASSQVSDGSKGKGKVE